MKFRQTKSLMITALMTGTLVTPCLNAKSYDLPRLNKVISDLEIKVWTKNEQELLDLSNKVVRQIQLHPRSPYGFYLLSHLKLREFTNAPEDFALVRQSSELAQQAIDLAPTNEVGYVALAEALDVAGQSEKASKLLSTFCRLGSRAWMALLFHAGPLAGSKCFKKKRFWPC